LAQKVQIVDEGNNVCSPIKSSCSIFGCFGGGELIRGHPNEFFNLGDKDVVARLKN
jgi:hypothetical protein